MIRPLLSLCAPGGRRARLSILIFHRVTPTVDPLFPDEVDAAQFERICGWLKSWFNVLALPEAVDRLYRGELPERSLAVTFDDGYADNRTVAAPILERMGLPCTFFVSTGFLDGGCMWNDVIIEAVRRTSMSAIDLRGLGFEPSNVQLFDLAARRHVIDQLIKYAKYQHPSEREQFVRSIAARAEIARPHDLMMTSAQVKELHLLGFTVGAHTVTHPILAGLAKDQARHEIETSKKELEALTSASVSLFAYPNGKLRADYDDRAVCLAREAGFDAAVTTNWGAATAQSDRFQLQRFTPWDRTRLRFGMRLVRNAIISKPDEASASAV